MPKMVLEIPAELAEAMRLPPGEREARLRIELALRLYQKGILSLGNARRLAGLGKWEFLALLGEEGIPRHYDEEELDEDLKAVEGLD